MYTQIILASAFGALCGAWLARRLAICPARPAFCRAATGSVLGAAAALFLVWPQAVAQVRAEDSPAHGVQSVAEFKQMIADTPVVLVDFYADWCPPCKRLKPTIHELARDYKDRVKVLIVDVDKLGELAREHGIKGIPDVRVFKGGKQVAQLVGLRPKDAYIEALDAALAP